MFVGFYFQMFKFQLANRFKQDQNHEKWFYIKGYKERLKCDSLDKRSSLIGEVQRQLIHLFTGIILILLVWLAGSIALAVLLLLITSMYLYQQ